MIKNLPAGKANVKYRYFSLLSVLIPLLLFSCDRDGHAQEIEILLKGGHVIDPKNKIDAPMDVAIANGKIA